MVSSRVIWAFLFGVGLFSAQAQPQAAWHLALDSAGVKVFAFEDETTHELSCKVVSGLHCSVPEAMAYFRDFGNYADWITVYEQSVLLRQPSENEILGYVTYRPEFNLYPGKRVDAVIRLQITQAGDSWVGNFTAVPDEIPEKEGFIRQPYFNATWALVKRKNSVCAFTYTAKVINIGPVGGAAAQSYIRANYLNVLALRNVFDNTAH